MCSGMGVESFLDRHIRPHVHVRDTLEVTVDWRALLAPNTLLLLQ